MLLPNSRDRIMPKQKRLRAEPVVEIVSPDTGTVVGWRYRWDDGTESRVSVSDFPPSLLQPGCTVAGDGRPRPTERFVAVVHEPGETVKE